MNTGERTTSNQHAHGPSNDTQTLFAFIRVHPWFYNLTYRSTVRPA